MHSRGPILIVTFNPLDLEDPNHNAYFFLLLIRQPDSCQVKGRNGRLMAHNLLSTIETTSMTRRQCGYVTATGVRVQHSALERCDSATDHSTRGYYGIDANHQSDWRRTDALRITGAGPDTRSEAPCAVPTTRASWFAVA